MFVYSDCVAPQRGIINGLDDFERGENLLQYDHYNNFAFRLNQESRWKVRIYAVEI